MILPLMLLTSSTITNKKTAKNIQSDCHTFWSDWLVLIRSDWHQWLPTPSPFFLAWRNVSPVVYGSWVLELDSTTCWLAFTIPMWGWEAASYSREQLFISSPLREKLQSESSESSLQSQTSQILRMLHEYFSNQATYNAGVLGIPHQSLGTITLKYKLKALHSVCASGLKDLPASQQARAKHIP